jgi:endo-1,4-beta-xylanase
MRNSASALLRACVFACLPLTALAQSPVVVEAESGMLGANLTTGSDAAAGVNYISVLPAANAGVNPTPDRTATYQVTFPAAGSYALYVRILAGPNNGNDDSFYVPTGFNTVTSWSGAYNTSSGGATAAGATVPVGGSAGTSVWKWQRLTPQIGGGAGIGPTSWVVPAGALTQTFAWGSREDGLLFDKFAFGPVDVCYTVGDLDAVRSPTGTCPPLPPPTPPAYTRVGQPLATGADRFLGSAWSPGNASLNFGAYWNQVTPENGGKWGSAEPARGVFNFAAAHQAEAQALASGGPFKWHVLFWGNQQPNWMYDLPPDQQLDEIHKWLAAIANEFPNIDQIDVVNEALHDPPDKTSTGNTTNTSGSGGYVEALGGKGVTGWDWIINAFTLARQYFPNSKLILNDYSITNSDASTTAHLEIVKLLQDRGLIDAIGIQAHAFEFNYNDLPISAVTHRLNLARLAETGLPIYVTEFDLDGVDPVFGVQDDNLQLQRYQALFPVFWESPGVKGITMWGYVQNSHWRTAQGAWLMYTNGAERPALQWLVKYVPDKPPVVTAGQVLSVNETPESPERTAARAFLVENGYTANDTTITTAALMAAHPGAPFVYQGETFVGGLENYNDSNFQALAFYTHYGHVGGIPVGKVVATDPDADTTLSQWQMFSNCSQFAINPDTGMVNVIVGAILDFESYYSCTARVSVWDGYKRSELQTVLIKTNNLNDNVPEITAGQAFDIDGGSHNVIDALEVSDPDDASQPGFTTFSNFALVSGNTNSVFRLRASSGVLEVARPLSIDWRKSSYALTAKVSDGTNTSAAQAVTVNIPKRVELCLANIIRLEVPKATAPLAILLGSQLGDCRRPL